MSYSLDWISALKALFIPMDTFLLVTTIVPIVFVVYMVKKNKNSRYLWLISTFTIIITMVAIVSPIVGTGWILRDNMLEIKAWPTSTTINLSLANVALVDDSSAWQPAIRTYGYGSPGLRTGYFKLRNGQEAMVFYYLKDSKILVLQLNDSYYLLAHPGVEELYKKLLTMGVKTSVQQIQ